MTNPRRVAQDESFVFETYIGDRMLAVEPGDEACKERMQGGKERMERGGGFASWQQGRPPTGTKSEVAHRKVACGDDYEQQ